MTEASAEVTFRTFGWFLCMAGEALRRGSLAAVAGSSSKEAGPAAGAKNLEHEKGIRWMPWHQEAMKDVARCEKPRGAASRR